MAKRSSARLRGRNSSTPKRVSLSHDAANFIPATAPVKLSALHEIDEMPGAFPGSMSPPAQNTPTRTSSAVNKAESAASVKHVNVTPKQSTPIKPSSEEMHPKQHQQSTAKPLEEARWLGFSNMAPHTEPPKQTSKIATLQGTPTKAPKTIDPPRFEFTFKREFSLELSPDAKKLMNEKRDEAAKIREQMIADGEGFKDVAAGAGRKMATPKGKKGRFSDVHLQQFSKMDSIAGHASAYRADSNKAKATETVILTHTEGQKALYPQLSASKSLKRSPSKAKLDDSDEATPKSAQKIARKPVPAQSAAQLPRSTPFKNLRDQASEESSSPSKRVKRIDTDDTSTTRPQSNDIGPPPPSTPRSNAASAKRPSHTFNSPTQSFLAHLSSVNTLKGSKIPAPSLTRSPSKATLQEPNRESPKPSTPLLARSPSKISLFANPTVEKPKAMLSPFFTRTPIKASTIKPVPSEDQPEQKIKEAPLLSRSPLKMSVAKNPDSSASENKPSSTIPFLSRSPAKITLPQDSPSTQTPGKSSSGNLMSRFVLLRSSPTKSILRSPQRLYSDDPAKVAAGTHLASPADVKVGKNKPLPAAPSTGTPPEKHVDFTSSTKKRHEDSQSEDSNTPSKGPTPPPKDESVKPSPAKPIFAAYPSLPTASETPSTPEKSVKRRQTAAIASGGGDFTFTSHGHQGIIFSQSPKAPPSAEKLASTIRHVSAEPQFPPPSGPAATGSKKRKFAFENKLVADEPPATFAEKGYASDKENAPNEVVLEGEEEQQQRPAKRVKTAAMKTVEVKRPATRLPTLGVKPRGAKTEVKEKKPSTISKARLAALAQPKRRG